MKNNGELGSQVAFSAARWLAVEATRANETQEPPSSKQTCAWPAVEHQPKAAASLQPAAFSALWWRPAQMPHAAAVVSDWQLSASAWRQGPNAQSVRYARQQSQRQQGQI